MPPMEFEPMTLVLGRATTGHDFDRAATVIVMNYTWRANIRALQ
jgi:hypothetical protein